jgi:galactose mutarotase-like enzyme
MIPTGAEERERAEDEPIGDRTVDQGYALADDRRFALAGRGVHIDVELDAGYSFGQVWIPPGRTFACIEPMTAPTNALRTGDHATATPEEPYSATYALRPRTI